MADQSDVENVLVTLAATALYPQGTSAPSVAGADCRIYRGWPNSAALDADLAAGKINVTVFPGTGAGRTTTRYAQEWVGTPAQPGLTMLVSGNTVTLGGTAGPGQLAGLLIDGQSYVYRNKAGDTPVLVAANLATLVRANAIVQLSGAVISIPGAGKLLARIVADAPALYETRRQNQSFRVICWCPTPKMRDATAIAIDGSLASIHFVNFPDTTVGRLVYLGTTVFDQSQDALLYRRDLLYSVEYPTVLAVSQPAMLFGDLAINAAHFTV
jgi:hypothetical protein